MKTLIEIFNELGIRKTDASKGESYWDNNGAYQKENDELWEKLVPAQGSAETLHGELIRAINRLFYEYCNNGNCNAADVHYASERDWWDRDDNEDDYDEDEIVDVEVSKYYGQFLDLIEKSICDKIPSEYVIGMTEDIAEVINYAPYVTRHSDYFNQKNMERYNVMCDMVMWYVLNTEDRELPDWYKKD